MQWLRNKEILMQEHQLDIEKGRQLELLTNSPGWEHVLEVLKQFEHEAVDELLSYQGSDLNVLRSKQLAARIVREVCAGINLRIDTAIEAARQLLILTESEDIHYE